MRGRGPWDLAIPPIRDVDEEDIRPVERPPWIANYSHGRVPGYATQGQVSTLFNHRDRPIGNHQGPDLPDDDPMAT